MGIRYIDDLRLIVLANDKSNENIQKHTESDKIFHRQSSRLFNPHGNRMAARPLTANGGQIWSGVF